MTDGPAYRERLTAPPSWWVAAAAFGIACGWIVLVISFWVPALVTAVVVAAAVGIGVHRLGSLQITVDRSGLRAGRAHLDRSFVGEVESLHRDDYRRRLGVDADARAHLITRPYLDRGVAVHVADPDDPVPYWLVSTRRPDALAEAIGAVNHLDPAPRPEGITGVQEV